MNIIESTRLFEDWLATQTTIVRADLAVKHREMCTDPFVFLRATFYRWAQLFPELLPELADAPLVLGPADLHVENFGTWRDSEGRLIWGINDGDEKAPVPFTNDLVRLTTSGRFAIVLGRMKITKADAFSAVARGYRKRMKEGVVKPFVLAEDHLELGRMAVSRLRSPQLFWQHMQEQLTAIAKMPDEALKILISSLPDDSLPTRHYRRLAGKGSLGRQRFVALAQFEGGLIAREVKAKVQSAWFWANPKTKATMLTKYDESGKHFGDPSVADKGEWTVRRLAPDCSKIDLASLRANRDEEILFEAMGAETANFHLATGCDPARIVAFLRTLKPNWLHDAAKTMSDATKEDYIDWCRHMRRPPHQSAG